MIANFLFVKTIARSRSTLFLGLTIAVSLFGACSSAPKPEAEHEEEAIARTEFTDRIENFFEYAPLKAGQTSQFLIHLTDLTDGTPVEKAEVTLVTRTKSGAEVMQTKARVGKVTGIYVADVSIPSKGDYDIEFHVKNAKLEERMALIDFKVE
jgi:5-hydroxyisourate hydrolase-like protein (transthyretin family)